MTRIDNRIDTCRGTLKAVVECGYRFFRGVIARMVLPETEWQAVRREHLSELKRELRDVRQATAYEPTKTPDLVRKRKVLEDILHACEACPRENRKRIRQGLPPQCALYKATVPRVTKEGDLKA